jgi:hypothetical protein
MLKRFLTLFEGLVGPDQTTTNSKRCAYILCYNQFQKSWNRCHKTFEFQQTSIPPPPPPPVQCCVPFLIRFDVFGLNNIDWGGGRGAAAIVCKKTVMIHLQSKTTFVPTTSASDCLGPICHNIIVYLKSTGDRMLCERSISAPFHSQMI